ncbi:MAG: nucleoside-diphosphate kinase [Deinococcus sp.]|nr:nucleoside-diphosphate kinase [Deinococcus sp.]
MTFTFVMVKPDGVRRSLVGEVISRLERKGLRIVGLKQLVISPELAERHYGEHKGKPFYSGLVKFITSGPVVAMVLEGPDAINQVRTLMGATDPAKAPPGSMRGDLATAIEENIVHGSDSEASAQREIGLFFRPEELLR